MGSIRETLSVVRSILTSRWYWMMVAIAGAVFVTPFLIIILIINLPSPLNFLSTVLIVIAWGVVAGYKDWIVAKAKDEKQKIQEQDAS